MSWQERLTANIQELQEAARRYEDTATPEPARQKARLIMSDERCQLCGAVVVPLFRVPGPYVCADCVNEFREKAAGGADLFCDQPKRFIQ